MTDEEIMKLDLEQTRLVAQRCQAELEQNRAELLEWKLHAAHDVRVKTRLRAVVDPRPENQAAAVEAEAAVERVLAAIDSHAALVGGLEQTLLAAKMWTRRLIQAQEGERLAAGVAAMKARADDAVADIKRVLPDLISYAVLDGANFQAEDTIRLLEVFSKIDLQAMYDAAHETEAKVRIGEMTL